MVILNLTVIQIEIIYNHRLALWLSFDYNCHRSWWASPRGQSYEYQYDNDLDLDYQHEYHDDGGPWVSSLW